MQMPMACSFGSGIVNPRIRMNTEVTNVACPGCGCVCDDLTLTVTGDRLVGVEKACAVGEQWLDRHADARRSAVEVDGRVVEFGTAVSRAAELLRSLELAAGLRPARSATSGQRAAVALADQSER